jgi:O-methyltransferase
MNKMEGAFVECGVWRGGHAIAAKLIFNKMNYFPKIYLFDTFAGMTEPSEEDVHISTGKTVFDKYFNSKKSNYVDWCYSSIEEVKENITNAGLDYKDINFIQGDVMSTLKDKNNIPKKISILRLDTDWYESTKLELEILYPNLLKKGFLIIDDYGHWQGQKKAVDEFFGTNQRPFFNIIDPLSSRIVVKT